MSQPARPTVSLVIVSRGRPAFLARCMTAVAHLDHPAFEVVVVADPAGLAAIGDRPVKAVPFDQPNISAARNRGILAAAGEVVAFLDDDAVPEPLWLWHLTRAFANPTVHAAGGYVLGWNGLSFEWAGGAVNDDLTTAPLAQSDAGLSLHVNRPGRAVEVKGVNCAYRRDVLLQLGGFDPHLRYYLDETELNLRLAALGGSTAIVPDARVHHTKAKSAQRDASRIPRNLHDVGYSTAITLRRHAPADRRGAAHDRQRQEQVARLGFLLRKGRLTEAASRELLQSYDRGFAEGLAADLVAPSALQDTGATFLPFPGQSGELVTLAGRPWQRRRLAAEASALADGGRIVRLFIFSPTALYHRRRFADGVWEQHGGLFGKSLRSDPVFRLWRFSRRLSRESGLFLSGFWKS